MSKIAAFFLVCFAFSVASNASPVKLSPEVREFVSVDADVIALTHVKVIDGTGAAAADDQSIVIRDGRIAAIGPAGSVAIPDGAKVMELRGRTVIPGLVMMHEHMFYPTGKLSLFNEHGWSFPRLYLAAGVTTARTAGSVEPYTDINLKHMIDRGDVAGPKMFVTGPFLDGEGTFAPQFRALKTAQDAKKMVDYWSDEGATSFKAYMYIRRDQLRSAIDAAHTRGLKVTGHLCSVTFSEAADLGIDNLEHGLIVNTEYLPEKKADVCAPQTKTVENFATLDLASEKVQATIRKLVEKKVAITSTLAVFEALTPDRPPLQDRVLEAMTPDARVQYLSRRARSAQSKTPIWPKALKKEMEFELAFVKAGGILLAGTDPTGNGGALAGFGSQRQVQLLVEAGFTPLEAIRIATLHGATFLGVADDVGTVAVGRSADLVVIAGDPSTDIADIEKVETVFKDGIGYDSTKLIHSIRGSVGWR